MRYVWDHFDDYLSGNVLKDTALRAARGPLRRWDRRTAAPIDEIAADSAHIAGKIARFWKRDARVIHPPVDLETFRPDGLPPDDYFLVFGANAPYKQFGRAIAAARQAGVRLIVAGKGTEDLRPLAHGDPRIEIIGEVAREEDVVKLYQRCRALL